MQAPFSTPLKGPGPGQKITAPHLSQQPGSGRAGWFKKAVAWLLMFTVNVASLGQAVGQVVRGQGGAPYTGFTRSGVYVQGGQMVGNPHQILHDMNNPALWTTAAVSFTNTTDPNFIQASLADIEAAIAVSPEPGGLALSRLYITAPPANPYTLAPPNDATVTNAAAYEQLLLDAQAGGYEPIADGTYIAKTHDSSSPQIANRGLNLYHTKPVFVAAEDPYGGATAFFALQGAQAKNHLSHLQQQNAALLGSAIFFSQQKLPTPQNWGASTDWEGNRIDPGAAFDQALGSIPQNGSNYSVNGNGFTVGYIRPDGQAHDFNLATDPHFRQLQQGQYQYSDSYLPTPNLNELLGQELRRAAEQHNKGQEAAASIDFRTFNEERDMFMQGLDLYRHVNKGDWYLLDGLRTGQITAGHPDYARALALSQDAFRQAYAYHTEYETQLKYNKESAKWQADNAELGKFSDQELFEKFYLFDKKADARGEQLLRDLQAGRLTAGTPEYEEARALADARARVQIQIALEPPKKKKWYEKLADPLLKMGKALAWPKPQYVFDAVQAQPGQKQVDEIILKDPTLYAIGKAAVTTVATVFTIGLGGAGAAATWDAYYTYAATGDMDAAHKVGLKSFGTAAISAGVMSGIGQGLGSASGLNWYTGSVVDAASALQVVQSITAHTLSDAIANTIVHGGSFAENLEKSLGTALIAAGTAYSANLIGDYSEVLGEVGTELAHAGLGCVGGALSSGSSDGCAAGAAGAATAHAFTQWYDPANGKTLDDLSQSEKYLIVQVGGIIGGAVASIVGGSSGDALANFDLGQQTGANAVENNYLMHLEAQRRAQLQQQCKETGGCTAALLDELAALDALDKQRDADLRSACSSSYGGSSGSAACKTELGNLQAARLSYGVLFQGMTGQDWINESANVGKIVQFLNGYGQGADESLSNLPARDKLTNLPLDDQGRYSATVAVGGELHRPKFFSCATTECMRSGANLDMSDPATQAYVKAIDRQIFKDIGTGATLGSLVTPVGVGGRGLFLLGLLASGGEIAIGDNPTNATIDETIKTISEVGGEKLFKDVLGHSPATAARAASLINLAGGWDAFTERVKIDLLGLKSNE